MLVFASVHLVAIKTHNNDITLNTIFSYNVYHLEDPMDHCGARGCLGIKMKKESQWAREREIRAMR